MATDPAISNEAIGCWDPEQLIAHLQRTLHHDGAPDPVEDMQPLALSPHRGFFADWLNAHANHEEGGLAPGQVVLLSAGAVAHEFCALYTSDALYAGHPTLLVTPRINPSRVCRSITSQQLPAERPDNWMGSWPLDSEEFPEHSLKEWLLASSANERLRLNWPYVTDVLRSRLLQIAPTAGASVLSPIGLTRLAQEFVTEVANNAALKNRISLLVINQLEGVSRANHLSGNEARLEAVALLSRLAYNGNMVLLVVVDQIDSELHSLADFSMHVQPVNKAGGGREFGGAVYTVAKPAQVGGVSVDELADIMRNNSMDSSERMVTSESDTGSAPVGSAPAGSAPVAEQTYRLSYRRHYEDNPEHILIRSHNGGFNMPVQEIVKWQDRD